MSYVVVVYAAGECIAYPQTRCAVKAYGPFEDAEDAAQYALQFPELVAPHKIVLIDPSMEVPQ